MASRKSGTDSVEAFVGIDPSTSNTGVVVLGTDGQLQLCFDGKKAIQYAKYECDTEEYLAQATYIVDKLKPYKILGMAYEDYSFNSVHRAFTLGEYGGVLKAALWQNFNTHLMLVAPMRNKKFATGYGYAEKYMMMEQAANECQQLAGASDDICDAYFLAKYALYASDPHKAAMLDRGNPHLRTRLELVIH